MKFITTILFFILFVISAKATEVTFIGKIKNYQSTEVDFILHDNELLKEDKIYRARINDQNEFSVLIPINHAQILKIKVDEKVLHLFVSPKSHRLVFEYDNNSPESSLVLKGKNVHDNSFYNTFCRSYKWNESKKEAYEMGGLKTLVSPDVKRMATSYSITDYFRIMDEERKNQINYLQKGMSLSIDFYRFIENEINWKYETNKLAYFLFNKDRFSVADLRGYWVRYMLLQSTTINDDKSVDFNSYQNMLNAFIHFLHLQTPVKTKIESSYYTFIKVNLQGKPRYFMLAKLMIANYQNGENPALARKNLKAFKKENPYKNYNTQLDKIFGKEMEYLSTKNAPNLKVLDLNEQEFWLNQYSGKVVYVSFWASWCAPCLQGFAESRNFRKEMESYGVVFLNVNLDEQEAIWRKTLPRHDIIGKNVYALDTKQAGKELKITSLPYYFLVDKSGKIAYLSSSKLIECREDFMQLLSD